MSVPMPHPDDHASIAAFFETWGRHVAALDYQAARPLFHDDVLGFGTHAATVRGLDTLMDRQWRRIWPAIGDFRFLIDTLAVQTSPCRQFALAAIGWDSIGYAADGEPFPRPGRATVGLDRAGLEGPWRGTHTHFSLHPGTPQRTHGGEFAAS